MGSFSVGLKLAELDDFIAPSQECIKPVEIAKKRQAKVKQLRLLACFVYGATIARIHRR